MAMALGAEAPLSSVLASGLERGDPAGAQRASASPVYLDQSAAELRLGLLRGDAYLDRFSVLRSSVLSRPWLTATASVIGASHLLRFEIPGAPVFSEVFACVELEAVPGCVYSAGLGELAGGVEREVVDGARHRFCAENLGSGAARTRLRELERRIEVAEGGEGESRELGLCFEFPCLPGGGGERARGEVSGPPRTLVWLELDDAMQEARAETAHSYPNQDRVVFSETRLRVHRLDGRRCG